MSVRSTPSHIGHLSFVIRSFLVDPFYVTPQKWPRLSKCNFTISLDFFGVQVIKKAEFEAAREIFERMIQLNLQPKKMKFFFKKYLEFETTHGDQQTIDKVRKKALNYVESKFGNGAADADVDPVEELMETLDDN